MIDTDALHFYLYTEWQKAGEMYRGAYWPTHFLGVKLDNPLTEEFVNKRLLRERALTKMDEIIGIGQQIFGKNYVPGYST